MEIKRPNPNSIEGHYSNLPQEQKLLDTLGKNYPRLKGLDMRVVQGYPQDNEGGGYLEFYPKKESRSPIPGKNVISFFDPSVLEDEARANQMLFGDTLHLLPYIDPEFSRLRRQYDKTVPQSQKIREYKEAQSRGENRPLDQWWEVSRLDAHIRGWLAKQWDREDEYGRYLFTDKRRKILKQMEELLKKPRRSTQRRKR
tara:strand:- start:1164 stop:1760 length:597 start_codon:yes stop_codon:yes gene_type:complete